MSIAELPTTYTEAEVAARLRVNPETLARARRAGRLPYTRVGKKIRYTPAHVAAYLEAQQCGSTSNPETASGRSAGQTSMDAPSANRLALQIAGRPKSN